MVNLIHPEIIFAVDALDGSDMLEVGVFGVFQIMQDGAGGDDACMHVLDAKPLQGMGLEMFEQAFRGIGLSNIQLSRV